MGTKAEETAPDATGCLAKAADDEPIFVLRAHDRLAAATLAHWIDLASLYQCPAAKIEEARVQLARMAAWQETNGCKLPD